MTLHINVTRVTRSLLIHYAKNDWKVTVKGRGATDILFGGEGWAGAKMLHQTEGGV